MASPQPVLATFDDAALAVVRGYLEHLDPRYLAEDVALAVGAAGYQRLGRAAVAAAVHDVRHRYFTDLHDDVLSITPVGERVVVELTVSGRPVATAWSRPLLRQRVTVGAVAFIDVQGGEITHIRIYHDASCLYDG